MISYILATLNKCFVLRSGEVQGIQKGTFDKKKAKHDLIYFNYVKRRQIQNLFTSAEISVTSFGVAEFSQNYAPKKIASTPNDVIAFIDDFIAAGL